MAGNSRFDMSSVYCIGSLRLPMKAWTSVPGSACVIETLTVFVVSPEMKQRAASPWLPVVPGTTTGSAFDADHTT